MQTFNQIESRARHVKFVGRNNQTLVEDGAVTEGFIDVPGAEGGLQIKVLTNKSGGEAQVEISTSLDRRVSKLSHGAIPAIRTISMKKNGSYHDGSLKNPAFKTV